MSSSTNGQRHETARAAADATPRATAHGTPQATADDDLRVAALPTPAGPLSVVVDADGAVRGSAFGPTDWLIARVGPAREVPAAELGAVADAVARYVAGDVDALDGVTVRQPGGPFRQAAWEAMRQVPAGTTVSYTELAAMVGRPSAVRAAASACARNLVAPFVPCHRVVRSDGSLGGYAYGLATKQALLDHERLSVADAAR